jgi:methionine-rich copper-binding protein CopC
MQRLYSSRRLWTSIVVIFVVAFVQTVSAQSEATRSFPKDNSVLDQAPKVVTIFLTEKIEDELSKLEVFDTDGNVVHKGKASCAENHKIISILMQDVGPGAYTSKWEVVSVDGHKTNGEFSFQVR